MRANSTFEIKSWDEKPYAEFDGGRKLTRASVKRLYRGDIEGESSTEYLMSYSSDGSASFVGLERVVGKLGGRAGSFVLEHTGTFSNGVATASWSIVPGSSTGALVGLRGQGKSSLGHDQLYSMPLDYDFEADQVDPRDDM